MVGTMFRNRISLYMKFAFANYLILLLSPRAKVGAFCFLENDTNCFLEFSIFKWLLTMKKLLR